MQQLTLAYRPTLFSEVWGQRAALRVLTGFIEKDRVPGTLLLSGPRGVGKTTIARILARRLNCLHPEGIDPCGACKSCMAENHPDILELNAASDRGIDMVRGLEQVSMLSPQYKRRVIILDEAHAITPSAGQALLKALEEVPPTACFVIVTTDPDKLPDTVLSRCSKLAFSNVASPVITKSLLAVAKAESVDLDPKAAKLITDACDGHPREALMLLEQALCLQSEGEDPGDWISLVKTVIKNTAKTVLIDFCKPLLSSEVEESLGVIGRLEEDMLADLFRRVIDVMDLWCIACATEKPYPNPKINKLKPKEDEDFFEKVFQGVETFSEWYYAAEQERLSFRQALNHAVIKFCLG